MTIATDLVIFSGSKVLLITRKWPPFQGMLALPGGMMERTETPLMCAVRELREETDLSVRPEDLTYLGVFDEVNRDPRDPETISHAYFHRGPNTDDFRHQVLALDDAATAGWYDIIDSASEKLAFDHHDILNKAISIEASTILNKKHQKNATLSGLQHTLIQFALTNNLKG